MGPIIVGIDIGLSGGLSDGTTHIDMPVIKVETKPARYVLDLLNKKKQYYKTGPKKGQVKMKLKSAAKYKTELNVQEIFNLLYKVDVAVFESPAMSFGNSAKTTATTNKNFGKLLACAELAKCKIIVVPPHKWKKDLKLSKDKEESVIMAEKLAGGSFRTPNGALMDGRAEAFLIRYHHINYTKEDTWKK